MRWQRLKMSTGRMRIRWPCHRSRRARHGQRLAYGAASRFPTEFGSRIIAPFLWKC